ncbi:MAG: protein kinase [Spirochaetes bacterium]|nr:protein kinase [Spirochaetota bacterium]
MLDIPKHYLKHVLAAFLITACSAVTFIACEKKVEAPSAEEEAREEAKRVQYRYFFIKEARAAHVVNDGILFTFLERDANRDRNHRMKVELSGDFINWEGTIRLNRGTNGIYYYLYEQPYKNDRAIIKKGRYFYRFRVDGIWMNDPLQPNTALDNDNQMVSYYEITNDIIFYKSNPIYKDNGVVMFFLSNANAREVYFTTDKHDFSPYLHQMSNDGTGLWTISFDTNDMPDGQYYYNFIVDERWEIDPKNYNIAVDRHRRRHSSVAIHRRSVD